MFYQVLESEKTFYPTDKGHMGERLLVFKSVTLAQAGVYTCRDSIYHHKARNISVTIYGKYIINRFYFFYRKQISP